MDYLLLKRIVTILMIFSHLLTFFWLLALYLISSFQDFLY